MKKELVLGIGNRLMMDDGIGVYIVEELRKRKTGNDTCYVSGETDASFCMQQIREASSVIIIDAAYLGNEPGSIYTIHIKQALQGPLNMFSMHELDLFRQIKIEGKDVEGIFIGVEPKEITFGMQLSDVLQNKLENITDKIEMVIESIRGA